MLLFLTTITHIFKCAGVHHLRTFTEAIFGSKCNGSEIKEIFMDDYKKVINGHEIGIENIVKDTKIKLKEIFDLWINDGYYCMTGPIKHPYDQYADETEFLVVSKVAKALVCDLDECEVRPNYVDETKKLLFREMRAMLLKLSLQTDATCIQYRKDLVNVEFTQKQISEQESIIDNIRMNCLNTALESDYREWLLEGDQEDCREYFENQCPGRIFKMQYINNFR